MMLDSEEYVEQAYFFRVLAERMDRGESTQELLAATRDEILATTKLPMAIDFMLGELNLTGAFATAMSRLPHYFTPFQTYVVSEAERETGRFDLHLAVEILRREAEYRSRSITPQGVFLFQFESLCRNRLGYDRGIAAIGGDPAFDASWRDWIESVRRQVGILELADMIYLASEFYAKDNARRGRDDAADAPRHLLFGEKEGRIALANRRKDPLFLFSALQRHLGYPAVPRPKAAAETPDLIPSLIRRVQKLESRLKLFEEEQRGGIDLSRFYAPPAPRRTEEIEDERGS
jgi:hypothetical protein